MSGTEAYTPPPQYSGFDADFYYNAYPDAQAAAEAGVSQRQHFETVGAASGGSPNQAVATIKNNVLDPTLPDGASVDPTMLQNSPDQEQQYQQLNEATPGPGQAAQADFTASQAVDPAQTAQADAPQDVNATIYQAKQVGEQTPEMRAAQGTVDPRSLVEAQTGGPGARGTVQGQLTNLLSGDMSWAAGAMRNAEEAMARRGLGTSSMAGAAITQAAIESALPIAQQDASIFAQFAMTNLNNRQQSAVLNAQKYHDVNMKNLDNRQQARLVNQQARLNTLLSDQAATNAARQFNASSNTQVDLFMSNLESTIEQFNAAQANSMEQFNTGIAQQNNQFNAGQSNQTSQFNAAQKTAYQQFRSQLQSMREQFNTQMRAQIDQSNVQWRRSINTANTAATNAAQQTNALNALNLSNWSLNSLWQQWRDEADHHFTSSESAKNRAYGLAYATLLNSFNRDNMEWQADQANARAVGGFVFDVVKDLASNLDF